MKCASFWNWLFILFHSASEIHSGRCTYQLFVVFIAWLYSTAWMCHLFIACWGAAGLFPAWDFKNKAALHIYVRVVLWTYVTKNVILGLYGKYLLSFVKKVPYFIQNSYIISQFHQKCVTIPPHPLMLSVIFTLWSWGERAHVGFNSHFPNGNAV